MTSHVKLRKERVGVIDYDTQIKEVRCQLVDQLKVLDVQLEQKSQQLQDLSDYLRRRGEIESEYARSLEKLTERFTSRIKRKDPSSHSVAQVWLALLSQTRQESRDHNALSERCSSFLTQPLTHCLEYTQRLAKKSKDVCNQLQDGLLKVTTELQTAWRTYYQYHSEYLCADGKLKEAEKQEEKQKQSANKKLERLIEKRQGKVKEINLKCSKARNDYLLNLAAANASMNKYYLQDISTLIDCADIGYHLSVGRVMKAYLSGRCQTQQNLSSGLQQLQGTVSGLDQSQDRDLLLQDHYSTFCLPLRFPYQPHDGDQVSEVSAEGEMRCELETRFKQIQTRLKSVSQETEEASKNMLAAQSSLLENIGDDDLEPSSQEGSTENLTVKPSVARRRASMQEMETIYFTRVKEHLTGSSLISKLQAKHDQLKEAVDKELSSGNQPRPNGKSMRVRRNHSCANLLHNQKLFSGDMMSFIQASGQQIPIVVESCICYINLNGLQHEGIFRVPGSQTEVNNLRDAFERGEDPLAERRYELDSVAGVLKLYFRSLENPLFPIDSTSQLLEHAQIRNEAERAAQLKMVIFSYPERVIVVMRYLFAFLHHVSQYSDENMMQPYNLAVCFGPSLVRGAQDEDVVALQPQINAVVKDIILQHESIFPNQSEVEGPMYEKCMTLELDDCEPIIEEGDVEAEYTHSKDEFEAGSLADNSPGSSAATHRKAERPRANSSGSIDKSKVTTGGGITSGGKVMLQIPIGPQSKQRRGQSPGYVRRVLQEHSSSEDIVIKVDKEVCRQMDTVFMELLSRQTLQDPSSSAASSPSAQGPQRKGKKDGRGGRGTGLFRAAEPMD
ncbi:rho GTPase-activating protein 4-like isoform X2 [Notothenia coriiceps]|uniref:Rho GTPase-activating protein 4-like isoform X2 n=1 Tax=Notothenia coriiceps TaxID=8208 RepID=A0A6I9PWI8_9TELE|nr:PREDICTED: rho GTPase-activating protein 4-like isoform X2 [Notothenia coriiceps]